MLASAKTIEVVAEIVREYNVQNIVLDPVGRVLAIYRTTSTQAVLTNIVGHGIYQWCTAPSWRCRSSIARKIATYDHSVDTKYP